MVFRSDFNIIKASLIATAFAIAGWLAFEGVTDIFDFSELNPLVKIGISILVVWLGFKLGIKKDAY